MVIITAQIDLSVGSVVGLAGGIAAIAQGWWGYGLIPSLAAGIAVAIAIQASPSVLASMRAGTATSVMHLVAR